MSDIRVKYLGNWRDVPGSEAGKPLVIDGGLLAYYTTSGAGALSYLTTISTDYPGRNWRLRKIEATFSAAPTTSENLTLTHNASEGVRNVHKSPVSSSRPDTVLFSNDPAATSATSIINTWEGQLDFPAGDEVTMAYTNTDVGTVKIEVSVEVL